MKHTYSPDTLSGLVNTLQQEVDMAAATPASPSEWTLQKIIGFSKAFSVQPSAVLGHFEEVCN